VKLIRLHLTNFKGIKSFTLEADGKGVDIYGDNATGKTTLMDAFLWLLFGKDSANRKDFDIKTLDESGEPLHGLDHEVEAVLEIGGKHIKLKKVFKEKWTKKRGSAEALFSGHTTDYYIDDVPVKQKDYLDRIEQIATEDVFRLLTNPKYFNEQLHWQDRRQILLEICGDISDEEVIAADKKLSKLTEIMDGRAMDDYRAMLKAQQKKINEELKTIPVRIDEATRGLPDIEGLDAKKAADKLSSLKNSIKKKEQALVRIDSGGEIAEKTKQMRELEAGLQELQNERAAKIQKQIEQKRAEMNAIPFGALGEIVVHKKTLEGNEQVIEALSPKLQELRDRWHEVDGKTFAFKQSDTCPTCGQSLPAEQLQATREKALAEFNLQKAEELKNITQQGKDAKAELERLKTENMGLQTKIAKLQKQHEQDEKKVIAIRKEIERLQQQAVMPDEKYSKMADKVFELQKEIEDLKAGTQDEKNKLREKIEILEESAGDAEKILSTISLHEQGKKRIEELKKQEETLAAEYARLEEALFLTEEFVRSKVRLLEEKINSKFRMARFKMFNVLVNGALEETCETLYEGVSYSTNLNAGHLIIVGMDIIRTLSEHYGFCPPIFVDNAEAVTDLPKMDAQVIRLVKPEIETEAEREKYSKLVVKIEENEKIKEAV